MVQSDLKGRASPRALTTARLVMIHDQAMTLPNVYGTFVGSKRRGNRHLKQKALVCIVVRKLPVRNLLRGRSVPKTYGWRANRRSRTLRTDVIAAAPQFVPQQAAVLGPADKVSAGTAHATVGIAIEHPTLGPCVTTAAHLFEFGGSNAAVRIRHGAATHVVQPHIRPITEFLDYVLLRPALTTPCANLFNEVRRIGPVHTPTEDDIGQRVFVLLATGERQATICRGVHARLEPPQEVLTDCILTDCVTLSGDSGACLVDESFRVWGLLRGRLAKTFSIFAPAHYVLDEENAQLL